MRFHRSQGFTLLEVLVALAILGTSMYAGFSLLQKTISNSDYLETKVLAHWVVQNALSEVNLAGQEVEEVNQTDKLVNMYGKEFLLNVATELMDETRSDDTVVTKLIIHIQVSIADHAETIIEDLSLERIL